MEAGEVSAWTTWAHSVNKLDANKIESENINIDLILSENREI